MAVNRRAYNIAYYQRNKPAIKTQQVQYRQNNAEVMRQRRILNSESRSTGRAVWSYALKLEIFAYYGPECSCGESRIGALHIDHITGGGRQHRRKINRQSGEDFYLWLRDNHFPAGYRTLCANCNWLAYLGSRLLSMTADAIYQRERHRQIKQQFMDRLGGVCQECRRANLDILTANHINLDGADHRRIVSNGQCGIYFYKAVLKSDDFTGLECMCFSCNDNHTYTGGHDRGSDTTE